MPSLTLLSHWHGVNQNPCSQNPTMWVNSPTSGFLSSALGPEFLLHIGQAHLLTQNCPEVKGKSLFKKPHSLVLSWLSDRPTHNSLSLFSSGLKGLRAVPPGHLLSSCLAFALWLSVQELSSPALHAPSLPSGLPQCHLMGNAFWLCPYSHPDFLCSTYHHQKHDWSGCPPL